MHHCVEGCEFDLCDSCFWGYRATRAQTVVSLLGIAADHVLDSRPFLAELRPINPKFDRRPPRRSQIEPTPVLFAQLLDIAERTLTLYLRAAEECRDALIGNSAKKELW